MKYSFFRLDSGYVGYPTSVVAEVTKEEPNIAIDSIDSKSLSISEKIAKDSSLELIGGGLYIPSLRLLSDNKQVLVAEVFENDFDYYIGKYEPITVKAQTNEDYIEHISNNVIQKLQEALVGEYQQWDAYVSLSRLVFGFQRTGISEEFLDHANDEFNHILLVSDLLVNSGVRPSTKRVGYQDASDTTGYLKVNLDMEEKAVKLYQEITKLINDDSSPITIEIQTIISKESEHARDIRQLLRYL